LASFHTLWEFGFWVSVQVALCFGYREVTGHWPDISNKEEMSANWEQKHLLLGAAQL
jgi:hypothetical protein